MCFDSNTAMQCDLEGFTLLVYSIVVAPCRLFPSFFCSLYIYTAWILHCVECMICANTHTHTHTHSLSQRHIKGLSMVSPKTFQHTHKGEEKNKNKTCNTESCIHSALCKLPPLQPLVLMYCLLSVIFFPFFPPTTVLLLECLAVSSLVYLIFCLSFLFVSCISLLLFLSHSFFI